MSKINMNSGGGFFERIKDFFKSIFSSKKNIITALIVLGSVIVVTILTIVIVHFVKVANAPKPPEKITINFEVYENSVEEENLLSGVQIFDNTSHLELYKSPSGKFSINSIDNNITKGILLKVEKEGYILGLSGENTSDVYSRNGYVFVKIDKDKTVIIVAEKEISEEEEALKRSVKLNFTDLNGMSIKENIKIFEKDSIPKDPVTNEPDYNQARVIASSEKGYIVLEIDENMTEDIATTYVIYSNNYDFEDITIYNIDRNTERDITGTIKQSVIEDTNRNFMNINISLKFPNGEYVNNNNVRYYYTNIYNDSRSNISGMAKNGMNLHGARKTGEESVISSDNNIIFDDKTMFDVIYFTVKTDEKYYFAYFFPTTSSETVFVTLTEGKIIQAYAGENVYVDITTEINSKETKITMKGNGSTGLIEFITDNGNFTFNDSISGNELYLVKANRNGDAIISNIEFDNENIIYNPNSNNVQLSSIKKED